MKKYNARKKEDQLRTQSESWDTRLVQRAKEGDIPTIDIEDYLGTEDPGLQGELADQLLNACLNVGFYYLKGHGIKPALITQTFEEARKFHHLPLSVKQELRMDREDWPVKGVGYLPFQNRKLPTRKKANANEAFIIKRQLASKITLDSNMWPAESLLPGFRKRIIEYGDEMEKLALKLLPIYAKALDLDSQFFKDAFSSPTYRLRLTKYPPLPKTNRDEFGIGPHVDSTFITILSQDEEGLIIYGERQKQWLLAPFVEGAFIINTGEFLRQWTNDRFVSVKHFANNNYSDRPRYSIPFFFNANADYRMHCIPTCCTDGPAKYPPFSYLESQAMVQGE